ncbi:hypothetical protein HMPREF1548_06934 [Clostridium sp. KLE 1755]|nr:hypothetical protein HMPREF1548_06934 [Clostridium sp. KLE 1755]
MSPSALATATHGLFIIHISQLKDISKNPLTFSSIFCIIEGLDKV